MIGVVVYVKAGDFTAGFDISTRGDQDFLQNNCVRLYVYKMKYIDEDKFSNGCCHKRCNWNVCLEIRYVKLDVFLNFFMLKLVILFHVEMARSYILDLATLKSKAKRHALSKKPFI